jgi:hypothetical protein
VQRSLDGSALLTGYALLVASGRLTEALKAGGEQVEI